MEHKQKALEKHYEWGGKIEVISRVPMQTREDLSLAYTPGVAEACLVIEKDEEESYRLTRRHNLVLVVTDGTAVLGLGDIGPAAGMPVMEGKCALFKAFADVDAFPLCVDSKDDDEIVNTIALISKSFGGINLEDIAAPRCFAIEEKLKKRCDIPVFHDDQHGTAIVVAAAVLNAIKVTHREMGKLKMVINGAGAAGTAIAKLLLSMGFGELILCDQKGAIYDDPNGDGNCLNENHREMAKYTNPRKVSGSLADALIGADLFIGVSKPGMLTGEMIMQMAKDPMIFAMANPTPEIMPEEAKAAGAAVVGTGRSDFANQINNVLAFPGIFKGALAVRAREINEQMKQAAAYAIANFIPDTALTPDYIMPSVLDRAVADAVATAVADAAVKSGVARKK